MVERQPLRHHWIIVPQGPWGPLSIAQWDYVITGLPITVLRKALYAPLQTTITSHPKERQQNEGKLMH